MQLFCSSEFALMQIVCRKAMNGAQVVCPSTTDSVNGLKVKGGDVFQTAVALPLCSLGENNLIVVLFKKEEVKSHDHETLGIFKIFSECVTRPKESTFIPIASQIAVDAAAERQHRETLEDVLSRALEMQCQNASFGGLSAPDDTAVPVTVPRTSTKARKSFEEYMLDIKKATGNKAAIKTDAEGKALPAPPPESAAELEPVSKKHDLASFLETNVPTETL